MRHHLTLASRQIPDIRPSGKWARCYRLRHELQLMSISGDGRSAPIFEPSSIII